MQKPCLLNILKTLWVTVIVLSRTIGLTRKMIPINFEVIFNIEVFSIISLKPVYCNVVLYLFKEIIKDF